MGSYKLISPLMSPLIGVITIVTLITTPLITSHEPPSRASGFRRGSGRAVGLIRDFHKSLLRVSCGL